MKEGPPQTDPGSPDSKFILTRLDEVAEMIDGGQLSRARDRLSGSAWLAGCDRSALSGRVVRSVQQWVDAAHDVLSSSTPDATLVRDILYQARKVVLDRPDTRAAD